MKLPTPDERATVLEARRGAKMARSAHAYVRGNTARFYEWLDDAPTARRVPAGPSVWICGDCHLSNLGPVADGKGRVEVQIRDVDQAVIGNPAHDLIRLGLSLATAARGSDLPGVATARIIEAMIEGYGAALHDPTSGDTGPEPDVVRSIKRRALGRRWRDLARERLADTRPTIPLGKMFWPLDDRERDALAQVIADPGVARLILSLASKADAADVELVDAAYWRKGCSSLGLLRFAAIVSTGERASGADYGLIDIKEAVAPVAPAARGATMPADHGERIVAAARALSPFLGSRMVASRLLDRSVFIRELAPQDLKLEVGQFSAADGARAARYLAFVVGKAHARQMDHQAREEWRDALEGDRGGAIDAPPWLWDSVVELAGRHEVGYLHHCRQYALRPSAG